MISKREGEEEISININDEFCCLLYIPYWGLSCNPYLGPEWELNLQPLGSWVDPKPLSNTGWAILTLLILLIQA